jgi:hypothetical protein
MKCCSINSSELGNFGVWGAEFYCNTSQESRDRVSKFRTEQRTKFEVLRLKNEMQHLKGFDRLLKETKKDLGFTSFYNITPTLNFKPRVNLLILYRLYTKFLGYQLNTEDKIKYEYDRLQNDRRTLEKINEKFLR